MRFCKCLILAGCLFFLLLPGYGQSFFSFSDNVLQHKIGFKLYRNIIVLPVYLNGEGPFNFILDTGAGNCIITDPNLVKQLNLEKGREITISGSGEGGGEKAYLVFNVSVSAQKIQSMPFTMAAFEEDPFFLSEYLGCAIHGILGFEFFNSFIVKINYRQQILTLSNPEKFEAKKKYSPMPMKLQNRRPFVEGFCVYENDTLHLEDILLDTGAGFPVSLETYSDSGIVVPQKNIFAELGVGLNGVILGSIGRTSMFGFHDYEFRNIVTAFPDYSSTGVKQISEQRNGSIGNFLLNRFTVIFDYAGGKMYLKPNANYKRTFPYDRTGIEVVATGDEYFQIIVKTVKKGSPAEEIGVLPGDEIEEINFQKITTYELSEIDHLLSNQNADSITLRIKRGNQIFYMIIAMRDMI